LVPPELRSSSWHDASLFLQHCTFSVACHFSHLLLSSAGIALALLLDTILKSNVMFLTDNQILLCVPYIPLEEDQSDISPIATTTITRLTSAISALLRVRRSLHDVSFPLLTCAVHGNYHLSAGLKHIMS